MILQSLKNGQLKQLILRLKQRYYYIKKKYILFKLFDKASLGRYIYCSVQP